MLYLHDRIIIRQNMTKSISHFNYTNNVYQVIELISTASRNKSLLDYSFFIIDITLL